MERSVENIIEWLTGEKEVELTMNQQGWVNKAKRLKEKYPDEVYLYENVDGSVFAKVPLKWIKISPPRRVEMSEERKEELRQRLSRIRKGQEL